jgi:hypothetical protein
VNPEAERLAASSPPPPLARSVEELRDAPRFTLLVRTAKLVVDGQEYLCVLRDASASGCKLRLFHGLPKAKSFALETSNGQRYPMDMMWARDDHAGFRFHDMIDVQELLADKRGPYAKRHVRVRLQCPIVVHALGRAIPAVLRDISTEGAKIDCSERMMLRQLLKLEIPGFPPTFGRVAWRQVPYHGLSFESGFPLDQLAHHLKAMYALQPQNAAGEAPPLLS